ncbi:hypothetical protein Emag_000086 [Eimeria magna]
MNKHTPLLLLLLLLLPLLQQQQQEGIKKPEAYQRGEMSNKGNAESSNNSNTKSSNNSSSSSKSSNSNSSNSSNSSSGRFPAPVFGMDEVCLCVLRPCSEVLGRDGIRLLGSSVSVCPSACQAPLPSIPPASRLSPTHSRDSQLLLLLLLLLIGHPDGGAPSLTGSPGGPPLRLDIGQRLAGALARGPPKRGGPSGALLVGRGGSPHSEGKRSIIAESRIYVFSLQIAFKRKRHIREKE